MTALPQSEEAILRRHVRAYALPAAVLITTLLGFMEGSL